MSAGDQSLERAHEHRVGGEYEVAIGLYQEVLVAEPECAEALWGLGLSLMNTGEFDEALELIVQAAQLEPDSQQYLLDAGKHYTMLGMYDEAKPFFERILELGADSKHGADARKQLSYYD